MELQRKRGMLVNRKRLGIFLFLASVFLGQVTGIPAQTTRVLTIDEAVAVALEKNRDIITAKEEMNKANYRIMEAASGAMPQVNGFWDTQRTLKQQIFVISFPDSTGKLQKNRLKIGTDYSGMLGANLVQPLYVGGKVGTALKAARIYKDLSNETLRSVQQSVVTGVVQTFNSVLLAREMKKIAGESLVQAEQHLKNVEVFWRVGKATEYDFLRARVNVSNLKPNLIEAENSIDLSMLRLKEIMGLRPDTPIDVRGSFSAPDTSLLERADKSVAFSHRPDLRASELNVDLYQKNIRIARGDFLPTITAGTTFMYMGLFDTMKYQAEDWSPYWYASINLSFPIFSGLKNYSRYKQAKVDHLKARTEYRKKRDATEIEVSQAVMNLKNAIEKIESQKMNREEAERALKLVESLYTNGKATQLEVLDAQLARDLAKSNMAQALYEGKVAEILLKSSLGLIELDSHERD